MQRNAPGMDLPEDLPRLVCLWKILIIGKEKFLRVGLQALEYFVFSRHGSNGHFIQGPDPGKEFVAKNCEMGVAVDSLS